MDETAITEIKLWGEHPEAWPERFSGQDTGDTFVVERAHMKDGRVLTWREWSTQESAR